mgnify:CR=1 FL=1
MLFNYFLNLRFITNLSANLNIYRSLDKMFFTFYEHNVRIECKHVFLVITTKVKDLVYDWFDKCSPHHGRMISL